MKQLKKSIAKALIIVLIMSSTLPCMATGNDVEQTYTSKIVEQLKEDLGEEKATEILNSGSESLIGETESSTTMDSNNGNDETTVEGSDNEESSEESTGNDTVEEPEEDITETSTESTKDNTNLTCTEEIVETSKTDVYEIIATSSDLEDNLLLEVEESEGNNSNLFGDGAPTTHTLNSDWFSGLSTEHPDNTILKKDITKIIIKKGGGASGISWDIDSTTGLKGYLNNTQVTIYAPNSEDTIKVGNGEHLFAGDYSGGYFSAPNTALEEIEGIDLLDLSTTTHISAMFAGCVELISLDLSSWNTQNVQHFSGMFFKCSGLTTLDVSFDTSSARYMNDMFYNCSSLTSLDVSGFDTGNVTQMSDMFYNCSSLTDINLSNFNTSNVSNGSCFAHMFYGCSSLNSLDLSNFVTSSATNLMAMFDSCSSLTNLNISNFNTSNVTNMSQMFRGCSSLISLDISSFETGNVTTMRRMFANNTLLETIIADENFITDNVTDSFEMFNGCVALVGGNNTIYDSIHIDKEYARIDITGTLGYFTEGNLGILTSVTKNTDPLKMSYKEGEYFDPSGLKIDAHYDSGRDKTITYNSSDNRWSFNPSIETQLTELTTNIAVSFDGIAIDGGYDIDIITLSNIGVNLPPTKVKYKVGEHFDPTGLKINLNYTDSTTDSVTYSATTMSAFTFTPATTSELTMTDTTITIGYGNKTTTQVIEVIEPTSISVKPNTNLKVKYAIGESFDPTNLYINVTYSDTTTVETISYTGNESDFSFSPSTLDTAGASVPVTITWTNNGNDFTCIQNVEVVELSSISVNLPPTTTRYMKGTNFDPTGLKINLNYSDTTTETVTYSTTTSAGFTFNGSSTLTLNTVGNPFVITIGYAGKTCTQNVIVAELSSISITTHATKLNYNAGETFDPTGLVITLTYSDNVTEPITYTTTTSTDFTFSPSGMLSRTGNVITIQYKTFDTMTMEETLNVKELTSITIATNPTKLSYASGQSLNPNGLVLTLTYTDSNDAVTTDTVTYNSTTQNKFAFNPSGALTSSGNITITYDGKTGTDLNPTFAISVTQSSGGYVPSGGGGSSGGGGGGGGGGIPAGTNPLNNTPTTTQIAENKSISAAVNGDTSTWVADPITGKWKLNVTLGDGQVAPASNGFYLLTNTVTEFVNGVTVPKQVNNTYYFDAQGNMVTGWVKTSDNKWYFFENAKTGNEGVMTIGWKEVSGGWYYFTADGSMLSSGVTPDGFVIGADGKWIG